MAGPFDLTGQNIENTYQRVLQTPDGATFYDGTGSLVTFTATAAAGGSNTQIQFNSASLLSGSSNFSFDYTTNNVILTGSILMSGSSAITGVDYIDFDTTVTTATSVGRLHWNDVDGTLELGLKGGVVSSELGQGLVTRVVNKTSPLIDLLATNYQVVVIGGAQGQRLSVRLAQADNDANSAGTLGVVAENIARNQEGFVITVGLLKNRDTTGALQGETWNDGDILYLSPTVAGRMTNIKPQAPQHTVIVGYVEYAHQNNGKIYVKIDNGYEIDELHNVRITTASLTPGQILVRSGSNNGGVWINSNQLTGSYGLTGSLTATSFTGSLFGTASTASYYQETDPIFTSKSASLATTGSNNFKGNQNISGSVTITGSLVVNDGIYNIIDTVNKILKDNGGTSAVDWQNKTLTGTRTTVDWGNNLLKDNASATSSIDWEQRYLYANDGTTIHIDWSNPSYMQLGSITESPITNILGIDGNGRVYYTASSAIGGGSSTPTFPYTGSAIISGSLIVTGSTTSTLGFTGSLFGTSSWANNVVSASFASTSSYFKNDTSIIERDGSGVLSITSDRVSINGPTNLTLSSSNNINLTGTTIVTGNLLPGSPITNNTSSWNLGSPNAAWKDLYVSNGSVYFVSGSVSASIGFINGAIDFNNTPVNIPSNSTVPTASFAQTASFLLGSVTSASFASTSSFYSGQSTVGANLITQTNPSAIRYLRINADNSISQLTTAQLQSDLGLPTTVVKTTNNSTPGSSTAWTNITDLSFSAAAGVLYEVKMVCILDSPTVGNGVKLGISSSVAADLVSWTFRSNASTANTSYQTSVAPSITYDGAVAGGAIAYTTNNIAILEGFIKLSSNGTVNGRFGNEVATSGATIHTCKSGSFLEYRQIA